MYVFHGTHEGHKRESYPLGLELQVAITYQVDTGN